MNKILSLFLTTIQSLFCFSGFIRNNFPEVYLIKIFYLDNLNQKNLIIIKKLYNCLVYNTDDFFSCIF